MKSILQFKNKKATLDLATLVVVIVGLLILAPVMLKIFNTTVGEVGDKLNESSTDAGAAMEKVENTFVTFWDYLIVIAFFVNVVMLLISAFMVDTHPVFLIMYIISAFVIMSFAPYTMEPVTQILGMPQFTTELGQLPMTSFVITNFNLILLGVIILSGLVLYAKFRGKGSDL